MSEINPHAFRIGQQARENSRNRSFNRETKPSLLRERSIAEEAQRVETSESEFAKRLIEKCAKQEGLTVEEFREKYKAV